MKVVSERRIPHVAGRTPRVPNMAELLYVVAPWALGGGLLTCIGGRAGAKIRNGEPLRRDAIVLHRSEYDAAPFSTQA